MKLDEALSHADDKLRALIRQDKARVVEEIRVMHNQQSATGFLSGTTLRKTTRIAVEAIKRRVEHVVSTLKECLLDVSPSVVDVKPLNPILDKFIPESLDDLGGHIHYIVSLLNTPNTLAPTLDPVIEVRKDELQKAQVDLKLYLASIYRASNKRFTPLNILAVASTSACLFFGVRWFLDPSGPYEPLIFLTSTATAALFALTAWFNRGK